MGAIVKVKAVVETAIYVDDLRAAETFYGAVLRLRVIGKELGRHVFVAVQPPSQGLTRRKRGRGRP
jgi:catechol 2,3-dioxygenase-like lactoylglutathione lyase family enzyme